MVQKPIDLTIMDTKQQIAKVAGESKLPLSILEMILGELLGQITAQLNSQIPQLRETYEKTLTQEKEQETTSK